MRVVVFENSALTRCNCFRIFRAGSNIKPVATFAVAIPVVVKGSTTPSVVFWSCGRMPRPQSKQSPTSSSLTWTDALNRSQFKFCGIYRTSENSFHLFSHRNRTVPWHCAPCGSLTKQRTHSHDDALTRLSSHSSSHLRSLAALSVLECYDGNTASGYLLPRRSPSRPVLPYGINTLYFLIMVIPLPTPPRPYSKIKFSDDFIFPNLQLLNPQREEHWNQLNDIEKGEKARTEASHRRRTSHKAHFRLARAFLPLPVILERLSRPLSRSFYSPFWPRCFFPIR